MGRTLSGSASGSDKTQYSQAFTANVWGGKRHSFTVPVGVSKLKATGVAAGGGIGGFSAMHSLDGGYNNLIFARINGVDPFFATTAHDVSQYLSLNIVGTQSTGTVVNNSGAGVNGSNDTALVGRNHGCYFNAADAVPWGISVSQSGDTTTNLVISSTTDGFNFTHAKSSSGLTASPSAYYKIDSVTFGGNGQAMVVPTSSDYIYYTADYGVTWATIANSVATAGANVTRVRYLNGTWIALTSNTSFYYTTTPASGAWTAKAHGLGLTSMDMGWTGTTYVMACGDATNIGICATLSGTWALQAHGGNLSFTTVVTGNGEVLLTRDGTSITSAASMRASSGAATTWVSVCPFSTGVSHHEAVKYIPFTSGGMWILGNNANSVAYSRTSLLSGSANAFTTASAIAGNALSNNTAINNVQWAGGNYVHLATGNGLGKYSSAGVITTSLNSAAQLTAEFGFTPSNAKAANLTITRNGTTLLTLLGGGTGGTNAGAGGGSGYSSPGTGRGCGPGGSGGVSAATTGVAQIPAGNGGWGGLTANGSVIANGGGGVPNVYGGLGGVPLPNTKIPGASGGGSLFSTSPGCGGGGGSLFSPAGNGYIPSDYIAPATVYGAASRIGAYGAGAHGTFTGSATCFSGGGGGESCYQYEINVTPGDVLTINVPGVSGVYCAANSTSAVPGGEGYCLLEWEI